MHCVQVREHSNPAFQSWPQKGKSIYYGRSGTMLGGAANEANNQCDNNAGIVKIAPSQALPEGATADCESDCESDACSDCESDA